MKFGCYALMLCFAATNVSFLPATTLDVEMETVAPFTAKVKKNKVRLRTEPNLEGHIVRELQKGDLLLVDGKSDDFFAIIPPSDIKGYIYRTYVLDGVIEANNVNVRLSPTLESTVILQLNAGDRVEGSISTENNRWLEIDLPESSRFFVAEELIENIGPGNLIHSLRNKKEEVDRKLLSAIEISNDQLEKPFPEIDLNAVSAPFHKIINEFHDFPEHVLKAKELLERIQEKYLQLKIAYLQGKAKESEELYVSKTKELENKLKEEEQEAKKKEAKKSFLKKAPSKTSPKMSEYIEQEMEYYELWSRNNEAATYEEFIEIQLKNAQDFEGIIDVYDRPIPNKPGNYLLLSKTSRLPIAYLYSTLLNLDDFLGKSVTISASPRPNHNFAYPALFVLEVNQ